MTRTTKKWVGIAVSIAIVLLFLFQRDREDSRMRRAWEHKYRHTRMQIGWHLTNLRHEYGTQQLHISQNTALGIRRLWDDRDVLLYVLRHQKSAFQADSLVKLEQLIDHHAPLTTVLKEIERIEQINDTD
ncbi:MAG TPA: hypothetical protein VN038_29240 [Dyadobacter sp.]|nr:hypothetical protein [Dyadobacter sp.]